MTSTPSDLDPVVAYAETASARLMEVAARPVWAMNPDAQAVALDALARLGSQVEALRLRVLAEADRSGAVVDLPKAEVRLARAIESHRELEERLVTGEVRVDQAKVIVTALGKLPATGEFAVTQSQVEDAEAFLVDHATRHTARELKRLSHHLFEVIAPEQAHALEGRILEAEEARALRKTSWVSWDDGHGLCHFQGVVPHLHGQMLTKALFALSEAEDLDEPTDVRRGLAFTRLIEAMDAKDLPKTGGRGATIVVTMTLEQLLTDLGACGLDTGGRISAAEARRLACGAGIIPAVLGGQGELLDLGSRRRFHTGRQRIALAHRDGGCTAAGCDKPPAMCHAHHEIPYSEGGLTTVKNGRLLCGTHHRRVHDPKWRHEKRTDGRIEFHRRT